MDLEALHNWLYGAAKGCEPVTVRGLMEELDSLRKGPEPQRYDDLPKDGISMIQGLERLALAGKATKVIHEGEVAWRWCEPPAKVQAQGELF
jgi:hypothetical protein